jgi:hypothetical protein
MSVVLRVLALSSGLSWRSAAVVFLVLLGYGMKASVVDTAAVMSDSQIVSSNDVDVSIWDTTPPTVISLFITNGGLAKNSPDPGDAVAIGFSEPIDLSSIKAGWDGTATPVTVTIGNDDVSYAGNDTVNFNVNLGVIDLGAADYTGAPNTILAGSMEWDDRRHRVEVTLGAYARDNAVVTSARVERTFYPDSGIQDTGRVSIDTTAKPTKTDKHF